MKADLSIFASGNIVASLPDGRIIMGQDAIEVAEKLAAEGVTVPEISYKNLEHAFTEPVEYKNKGGDHLFTDRGSRVTFDRVRVSDEEIRLALVHAQQKFGSPLTFIGNDKIFQNRMSKLAGEMGISVTE